MSYDRMDGVPPGADVNHDGRVDMTIQLTLNSAFVDACGYTASSGYFFTAGYANLRV